LSATQSWVKVSRDIALRLATIIGTMKFKSENTSNAVQNYQKNLAFSVLQFSNPETNGIYAVM